MFLISNALLSKQIENRQKLTQKKGSSERGFFVHRDLFVRKVFGGSRIYMVVSKLQKHFCDAL